MDPYAPMPQRGPAPQRDADRVDLRGLMRGIVRRYPLILGMMLGVGVLFFAVASFLPPTYTSWSKVILDPQNIQVTQNDAVLANADPSEAMIFSEMAVMRSNVLLGRLIDHLGIDRLETAFWGAPVEDSSDEGRVAALVEVLRDDLSVDRETQSYVVTIKAQGREAALTADIANGVADTYIEMQLESRRDGVRQATAWIQELATEAGQTVEAAEKALAEARSASLATEGASYDNANQQLSNLTSELAVARASLAAARAEYDRLQAILSEQGAEGVSKAVTSPLLESLVADRLALVRQDDDWARSFAADHPQRVRLAGEIAVIDQQLADEARRVVELRGNDVLVATARADALATSVKALEDQLAGISENTVDLRQREREAEAAQQTYQTLLARLSSASGQDKLQMPDARVIERAPLPDAPTAPRPKLLGVFGAMLGLTIGVISALVSEMTRTTFRARGEVEAETGLKVLATLPKVPGKSMRELIEGLRDNSESLFGERVRQLRTVLLMRAEAAGKQVFMVTSSRPGEGKSLTALALAEMSVLAGKSVVVVDADLRRSTLARSFGWRPRFDLTDFVLDRCDLSDAILSDPALGFDVLVTARHSTEAADELSADWLKPMMDELRRVYDVVIVDSPPVLEVADGLVLARAVDTILYVVQAETTPRPVVAEGLDALAVMRLGVAGIVLSQADPRHATYSQGYGYATHA